MFSVCACTTAIQAEVYALGGGLTMGRFDSGTLGYGVPLLLSSGTHAEPGPTRLSGSFALPCMALPVKRGLTAPPNQ